VRGCAPYEDDSCPAEGELPVLVEGVFGPPDDDPPNPAIEIEATHEHRIVTVDEWDCFEEVCDPYPVVACAVDIQLDDETGLPLLYRIEIAMDGDTEPTVAWLLGEPDASSLMFETGRRQDVAGGDVCTTVTPYDTAGNAGTPATTCTVVNPSSSPMPGPESGSGSEDTDDPTAADSEAEGCGCSAAPEGRWWSMFVLPLLFVVRRAGLRIPCRRADPAARR
jgi:hypothetical protein